MGNCQAAEAATVVIVHPGRKIERIYWSVSANEIMTSNPGHYVALVVSSPTAVSEDGRPVKQLKLLRPDDTLHIGSVYRLISFEDVLKEFAAKKCVKLGRLLKERGGLPSLEKRKKDDRRDSSKPLLNSEISKSHQVEQQQHQQVHRPGTSSSSGGMMNNNSSSSRGMGVGRHQHWKPALQSIAEIGN